MEINVIFQYCEQHKQKTIHLHCSWAEAAMSEPKLAETITMLKVLELD